MIAIEPFIENIYRIHKAAKNENLENQITLIHNALSNNRNEVKLLKQERDNIGGQSLLENSNLTFLKNEKNKYLVETILLDDIVDYLPLKLKKNSNKKGGH